MKAMTTDAPAVGCRPNLGDLVEYSAREKKFYGIVVGIARCQDDFEGTEFSCVRFDPWPEEVEPLFLLVDDAVVFWCGKAADVNVVSRADATMG